MWLDEKHLITEGSYKIAYQHTNSENHVKEWSHAANIIVDRTAPGASLLAPIIFAQVNFGNVLRGVIPGYASMEQGDSVQTLCNETKGPALVITPEHLTDHPIQVCFDRALLQSLDSEIIRFSYHVTDRAGNQSIESLPVDLTCNGIALTQ